MRLCEECLIHGQRGCPQFNRCPQAELPTGGLEDTEPSAPAADRRRRARFGGWLSGTVSGRPACELSPRDEGCGGKGSVEAGGGVGEVGGWRAAIVCVSFPIKPLMPSAAVQLWPSLPSQGPRPPELLGAGPAQGTSSGHDLSQRCVRPSNLLGSVTI